MRELKPEFISGIMIVFHEVDGRVIAGFEKRPRITSGRTKAIALQNMKEVLSGIDPTVLLSYRRHPKAIREMEDM